MVYSRVRIGIMQNLTWHITEELFAEVPLCLPFVPPQVVFRPPGLLVTKKKKQ